LSEEGIDTVQNLATSDIVGLIANTRLGIMKLLHWIDQALLYLHVGDDFKKLRRIGIRTATDFESIYIGLPKGNLTKTKQSLEKELETKAHREGRVYVPPVPPDLLQALENEDGLEGRIRNELIAICEDENYQRLRTIQLIQSWEERKHQSRRYIRKKARENKD
jgi:hypothetical protein